MECELTQQIHKKFKKLRSYMEIGKKPPYAYFEIGVSFCKHTPKLLKPLFNFVYLTFKKTTNGIFLYTTLFSIH